MLARGTATPFRYIIDAMRGAFAGHCLTTIMLEGVLVAAGLAVACRWIAGRVRPRERAAVIIPGHGPAFRPGPATPR